MITVDVYGPDFRKTDIAVAEKVFGCKLTKQQGYVGKDPLPGWFLYDYDPTGSGPDRRPYLHLFETDIKDAWLVIEKMKELGWRMILETVSLGLWRVEFWRVGRFQDNGNLGLLTGTCVDKSECVAICKAALDAVAPMLPGFEL